VGRSWLDRVYAAIPLATVFLALLALYSWEAARHASPWFFTDELELSQISRAVEATGHGARRGQPYFWQTLYTWLIAPGWAISSTSLAYAVVKYIGVATMTVAIFPTYLLARTVATPRAALFAAAGAVSAPALAYAPMILEEPLSYPYTAAAFLVMAMAIVRRTRWWIGVAVLVSVAGGFVKGELGILPVVFALAVVLYAFSSDAGHRWRTRWSRSDSGGAVVVGAGIVILVSALVGRFSHSWAIATGHYPGRMLDYGLWAVGALTIGLGALPVVAALAVLARPRSEQRTPELRAFMSLFISAAVAFGIYTAVKAAYLSTTFATRVEERNVIYLVPLVFVGAALWLDRPRLRWGPLLAAVGFVAYLFVATPYQLTTVPAGDSFGVAIAQLANRNLSFTPSRIEWTLIASLAISVVLLLAPRLLGQRPGLRIGVLVAAVGLVLAWNLTGELAATTYSNDQAEAIIRNYPRPLNWLDRVDHGQPALYLGQTLDSGADLGVWLTEFWNRSLKQVWSVDGSAPGPGPTLTPNILTTDGRLQPDPKLPYVVADAGVEVVGKVVARAGRWVVYKVRPPTRYAYTLAGIFADGQTGCSLQPCRGADSAYNQFSTPGNRPGYMTVDVSRLSACGAPVGPAGVRVTLGTLIKGADKQPHIGRLLAVQRWTLRIGTERRFVIRAPKPPFRVQVHISPTYSPARLGSSDPRQLGGQVSYTFTPTPTTAQLTTCR
jgi:hypothetical protein